MSLYEYEQGRELELYCLQHDIGFYAVIQCAFRMADADNRAALRLGFGAQFKELQQRYWAPGGRLEGENFTKRILDTKKEGAGR